MTCHRRSPPKSGFKASPDQRKKLLALWLAGDTRAVAALEREIGVAPKYTSNMASVMGIHKRDGVRPDADDPRWAWAVERGPIGYSYQGFSR